MNAQRIMDQAFTTGRIWLGGEMDLPANEGPEPAYQRAVMIAEECGYIVGRRGSSRFSVTGGDIPGEIILEWYEYDRLDLGCVEVWSCQSAHWPTRQRTRHDEKETA